MQPTSVTTDDPLLTVDELAVYLSVPKQSIFLMRHPRQAPPALNIGSGISFRKSAVDDWLAEHAEVLAS